MQKMKVYRYIAGLLLICFSVFLGHNLVPHQHHSKSFQSPITTDCPFEHWDQHHHDHDAESDHETEDQPVHCHAFNDVVFEKYSTPVNKTGKVQLRAMLFPGQTQAPELSILLSSSPFRLIEPPWISHPSVMTRALRGPPAFA
jgi:hypothetical protein